MLDEPLTMLAPNALAMMPARTAVFHFPAERQGQERDIPQKFSWKCPPVSKRKDSVGSRKSCFNLDTFLGS